MKTVARIIVEVLVWVAIFVLWLILLPIVIIVMAPIILIMSLIQKKPAKLMFIRLIEWWTGVSKSFPIFNETKENIDPLNGNETAEAERS